MDKLSKIDWVEAAIYAGVAIGLIVAIKKTDLMGLNSKYLGL